MGTGFLLHSSCKVGNRQPRCLGQLLSNCIPCNPKKTPQLIGGLLTLHTEDFRFRPWHLFEGLGKSCLKLGKATAGPCIDNITPRKVCTGFRTGNSFTQHIITLCNLLLQGALITSSTDCIKRGLSKLITNDDYSSG